MATADKFNCPKCGSGRTKPLSLAISEGTHRRSTVGFSSRRRVWTSSSTYKSDLVANLPERPSNEGAYGCIALGILGLLIALVLGSSEDALHGLAIGVGIVSALILLLGI